MTAITHNPSHEEKRTWGPLAFVSAAERQRILELPAPQRKRAIAHLEREIVTALRKPAR